MKNNLLRSKINWFYPVHIGSIRTISRSKTLTCNISFQHTPTVQCPHHGFFWGFTTRIIVVAKFSLENFFVVLYTHFFCMHAFTSGVITIFGGVSKATQPRDQEVCTSIKTFFFDSFCFSSLKIAISAITATVRPTTMYAFYLLWHVVIISVVWGLGKKERRKGRPTQGKAQQPKGILCMHILYVSDCC